MKLVDLTGKQFGRWTVINRTDKYVGHDPLWKCVCICGNEKEVTGGNLRGGRSTSCGCFRSENLIKTRSKETTPFNRVLYVYKRGAFVRNLEWNLTDDEFRNLVTGNCDYCGVPCSNIRTTEHFSSNLEIPLYSFAFNGIDRVDNEKGYVFENCVSCCKTCNVTKLAMSRTEFLSWVKRVYEHNYGSNN